MSGVRRGGSGWPGSARPATASRSHARCRSRATWGPGSAHPAGPASPAHPHDPRRRQATDRPSPAETHEEGKGPGGRGEARGLRVEDQQRHRRIHGRAGARAAPIQRDVDARRLRRPPCRADAARAPHRGRPRAAPRAPGRRPATGARAGAMEPPPSPRPSDARKLASRRSRGTDAVMPRPPRRPPRAPRGAAARVPWRRWLQPRSRAGGTARVAGACREQLCGTGDELIVTRPQPLREPDPAGHGLVQIDGGRVAMR